MQKLTGFEGLRSVEELGDGNFFERSFTIVSNERETTLSQGVAEFESALRCLLTTMGLNRIF